MPAATALWRLTGTCWSSEMGPSLSQPLAPVKGAAAGRGGTVACGDEPIPAHERRGTPASNWSCGGSLREGSLSNTDVCFITNGNTPRWAPYLTCSSKSEPDISKIAQSKEDFIVFSGSPSGQSLRRRTDHEATARPQTTGSRHSTPIPALGSPLQQDAIDVPAQIPALRLQQQGTKATSQQQQQYLRTTNTHYDH
ncbi:hypothetical protein J4Q44_G00052700 [Coregonus suidteri]|uniref:Uncharacterized protein n=1 Tax=Coregonus suidteri TaxID=861788 RepID=A0AAN8MFY6_9TELE